MPLTERDPNVSGRTSRASAASSARTRDSAKRKGDALVGPPGVMSMLRTTTELGDLGSLALPNRGSRPISRLSGGNARPSAGSTVSQVSGKRASNHHAWPSVSTAPRRSITSNITAPDPDQFLSGRTGVHEGPLAMPKAMHPAQEGRSFSLTAAVVPPPLSVAPHRSMTSLRNHEPVPRPRSPYIYPTRLKRPGFRSASPALSDVTGVPPNRYQSHRPGIPVPRFPYGPPVGNGRPQPRGPPYNQARGPYAPAGPMVGRPGAGAAWHESRLPRPVAPAQVVAPAPLRIRPALHATPSPAPASSQPSSSLPATPVDRSSLELMGSPTSVFDPSVTGQSMSGPAYYDYSEDFHHQSGKTRAAQHGRPLPPRSPPTVPMGFVHRIKSLLEDQGTEPEHMPGAWPSPVGMMAELPADDAAAELPADSVHPAHRIVAAAAMAADPMESIAHLITDVSEELRASEAVPERQDSVASSSPDSADTEASENDKDAQSKRLSAISEASSGQTAQSSHPAAIDVAIRYSAPQSVASLGSRAAPRSETGQVRHGASPPKAATAPLGSEPDVQAEETSDAGRATPRASTISTTGPSTGEIKIATEVVLGRKDRELALLEPRGTPARSHSLMLSKSSSPQETSSRYSEPTVRSVWSVDDTDQTCSDMITSSDIAVRISMPIEPIRPLDIRRALATEPAVNPPTKATASLEPEPPKTATPKIESALQVTVTDPTKTLDPERTISGPISPVRPGSEVLTRDSPVSPVQDDEPIGRATGKRKQTLSQPLTISIPPSLPERSSGLFGLIDARSSSDTVTDLPLHDFPKSRPASTDMRLSQFLRNHAGTGAILPELKEEERREEVSTSDFRISSFKFPKPAAGRRASFDSATGRMSKDSTMTGRSSMPMARPGSKALVDARALPSLHFSQTDLVGRLNLALGNRSNASIESIEDVPGDNRPKSEDIRARYRSFFAGWDEMDGPTPRNEVQTTGDVEPSPLLEEDGKDTALEKADSESDKEESEEAVECSRPMSPPSRPMSPQDIIQEVNRLHVPSVRGLTQRLSELIPSLREFCDEEDITDTGTVEETLNNIRMLGRRRIIKADGRVISLCNEDEFGLPDDASSPAELASGDGELNAADDGKRNSTATDTGAATFGSETLTNRLSTATQGTAASNSTDKTPVAELEAPLPAAVRGRSLTDSYGVVRGPSYPLLVSPDGRRSLDHIAHPPLGVVEARPWNLDTSYPWAREDMDIDISFPPPALHRDSPKAKPSRLRFSNDSEDEDLSDDDTIRDLDTNRAVDLISEDATRTTEDTFGSRRRRSRGRSVLGSVTKRLTLSSSSHKNDVNRAASAVNEAVANKASRAKTHTQSRSLDNSGFPLSADVLSLREDERSVDPGDRYPTTSLSTPNPFNLDEVRSFFSDDSSVAGGRTRERPGAQRGLSFGKRLTGLGKLKMGMARATSAMEQRDRNAGLKPNDALRMREGGAASPQGSDGSRSNRGRAGKRMDGVRSAMGTRTPSRQAQRQRQARAGAPDALDLGLSPAQRARLSLDLPLGQAGGEGDAMAAAPDPNASLATMGPDGAAAAAAAAGMSKTEFRARRLVERIKGIFSKSGSLIRSISGKAKRDVAASSNAEWGDEEVDGLARPVTRLTVYEGT